MVFLTGTSFARLTLAKSALTSSVKTAEKFDFPPFLTFARSTTARLKYELFRDVQWSQYVNSERGIDIYLFIGFVIRFPVRIQKPFVNIKNGFLFK